MGNPPGIKNCHFLNTMHDQTGPCGVSIDPNKKFDKEAKSNYLGMDLEKKLGKEGA